VQLPGVPLYLRSIQLSTIEKMRDGRFHYSATIGDLCFYQWRGISCVRMKSTLSGKRVKKSKEFEKTRQYASNFAIAARIASPVYKALPVDIRARWIYRTIVGEAASLLYKGKTESEVNDILWGKYIYNSPVENKENKTTTPAKETTRRRTGRLSLKKIFFTRWEIQGKIASDFKNAWKNPREYEIDSGKIMIDPFR